MHGCVCRSLTSRNNGLCGVTGKIASKRASGERSTGKTRLGQKRNRPVTVTPTVGHIGFCQQDSSEITRIPGLRLHRVHGDAMTAAEELTFPATVANGGYRSGSSLDRLSARTDAHGQHRVRRVVTGIEEGRKIRRCLKTRPFFASGFERWG